MPELSLLPKELESFGYYKKLIPMYLQDSEEFLSHFLALFKVGFANEGAICGNIICGTSTVTSGTSIYQTGKTIFKFLDLFNRLETTVPYLDIIEASGTTKCDMLDKLANLFGVTRNFSISLVEQGVTVKKELTLTDSDLFMLIKCQVIKNFFVGTFDDLMRCYDIIGLPIMPLTDSTYAAHCNVYLLLTNSAQVSQNVKDMFLTGMLSIESLGIFYTYAIQEAQNIAIFDSVLITATFDAGQFIM